MSCDTEWLTGWPRVLKERILLCSQERSVPLELPAAVALAAVSAALGKGLVVNSGRSRTTRANLFLLFGVPSGVGKSEVFRDVLGPLLAFEQDLHEWWEEEASPRALAGEELLKLKIASTRNSVRRSTIFRLETFRYLRAIQRDRAVCQRYVEPPSLLADDATSEALAEIMGKSGEAVASVSADARYLIKRLSIADSRDESFFLKAFSGDLALSNRVTRKAARLRSPCLTTLLLTQLDSYRGFLAKSRKTRSGLLPRFLHAELGSYRGRESARVDARSAGRVRRSYISLIEGLIEAYRFEISPQVVEPSVEVSRYMRKQEDLYRERAEQDSTIEGEVLRRRAEQMWRVALCLHAASCSDSSELSLLSLEHVKVAEAWVARILASG